MISLKVKKSVYEEQFKIIRKKIDARLNFIRILELFLLFLSKSFLILQNS